MKDKELHKIINRLLYPYYWFEHKLVKYIINKYLKECSEMTISSLYIDNSFPFWLRQYDDYTDSRYYDSYIRPKIQISYKPIQEKFDMNCIIKLSILKYKLRHFNFYFDYIKVN